MEESLPSCSAAQLRGSGDGEGRPSSTRVCDSCIRKKVKCDLGRPKCSRCFERGHTCTYSSTRRRPGPVPGFKRASRSGLSPLNRPSDPPGYQLNSPRLHNPEEEVLPDSSSTLTSADHLTQLSDASNSSSVSDLETRTQYSDSLDILPEEEECLYGSASPLSLPFFIPPKHQLRTFGNSNSWKIS
ncbi:hypothetical protein EDB80DRAFT_170604 [Ilyonectria destructans]|nr:hypothetical protein EDB80DRAFT_170604 [Ilyonectria destructans]